MNPLLVSNSDKQGGAARAAFRLHHAFRASDITSRMRVGAKVSDLNTVHGPASRIGKVLPRLRSFAVSQTTRLQRTNNSVLHSQALLPSRLLTGASTARTDVVHLHWVCGELLSIAEIGRINKPVVWTLHDMWPFCGAEHYASDDADARWRVGYRADNRPHGNKGLDLDRWVWRRKQKAWQRPMHIVAPSRWLADCVRDSALMKNWPVSVIPNTLDTRQFQPWPKALARQVLGLPEDKKLVLFGAIGGSRDPRKGWDLLQTALAQHVASQPDVECVIFGQSEPAEPPLVGLPLHWLGHLNDDATLALVYSAADVTVVPSRQEAFGQTASEAQSCGCPVVAFDCTGLPDVVEHGVTGYLATAYEPEDLAKGIAWVLEDDERHASLSDAARQRALRLWAPEVVVPQYLAVYEQAVQGAQAIHSNRHGI